jgi:hypothetical protein
MGRGERAVPGEAHRREERGGDGGNSGKFVSMELRFSKGGIRRQVDCISHSLHKCLLSSYCIPGVIPGAVGTAVDKPSPPLLSWNRHFLGMGR